MRGARVFASRRRLRAVPVVARGPPRRIAGAGAGMTGLSVLALTAAAVGALHSVAPDHWVPFAALARARRWPLAHTARVTILCGLGHVTVSAVLGIVALVTGLRAVHA